MKRYLLAAAIAMLLLACFAACVPGEKDGDIVTVSGTTTLTQTKSPNDSLVTTTRVPATTPITSTEQPTTSTQSPVTSTKVPATSTTPPAVSTTPSKTSTEPPVSLTEPPETTVNPPVTTTDATTTSTRPPVTTTAQLNPLQTGGTDNGDGWGELVPIKAGQ